MSRSFTGYACSTGYASLLSMIVSVSVRAADRLVAVPAAKHAADPLAAGNLLQLTLGLVVVLAAIVGSAWLLRRYGRLQSNMAGALRVIGGLSMGPRERVVLVQVGKQQLLLGVAPGRIQTLCVLDEPIAEPPRPAEQLKFAEQLGKVLGKR